MPVTSIDTLIEIDIIISELKNRELPPITNLEEEIAFIANNFPGAADNIKAAIENGDICGNDYSKCVYGHTTGCSVNLCVGISRMMRRHIKGSNFRQTFVEELIVYCEIGDTKNKNKKLKRLYDLILPHCTPSTSPEVTQEKEIPAHA